MIDYDAFLDWAERRFEGVKTGGNGEIQINSPFDPDRNDEKHKLWCSPSGGKNHREEGVYHCWISGKKGTLVGLVMEIDGVSREEALDTLGGDRSLAAFEQRLLEFYAPETYALPEVQTAEKPPGLTMPEGAVRIDSLFANDRRRLRAEQYIYGRKLDPKRYFLGVDGCYNDRVIIPYYDRDGNLIYYNGRHLWKKDPKYLGPPKDLGVGKGDVVYMPEWPEDGYEIYITEGEFDADSIHRAGLWAAAVGGANLTWNQVKILRNYHPIVAVDNDVAGEAALGRIASDLRANGLESLRYIRAPEGVKDWNELLVRFNKAVLRKYLLERAKPYDGILI